MTTRRLGEVWEQERRFGVVTFVVVADRYEAWGYGHDVLVLASSNRSYVAGEIVKMSPAGSQVMSALGDGFRRLT